MKIHIISSTKEKLDNFLAFNKPYITGAKVKVIEGGDGCFHCFITVKE